MSIRGALLIAASLTIGGSAGAQTDASAKLAGAWLERDTNTALAPTRLAALPEARRAEWQRYLERSRTARATDQALLTRELSELGRSTMTRAPYAKEFSVRPAMTAAWFATDSARSAADHMLTWQTPSGGWSKHVDVMLRPRAKGESFFSENENWQYIATIDNGSTTSEMEFLARANAAKPDARYRDAFMRGLQYLLDAQFPNGCWPQVYPLQGGYHDAATFNDDATLDALELLRGVARGAYAFVPTAERTRAANAAHQAAECILDAQVLVDGRRTVWGQQHDPVTLAPTSARSYELASLSAQESAHLVDFLMTLEQPTPRTIDAVLAAVAWLEGTSVRGYTWDFATGLHEAPGAGPLWARMYEIGTNRPIFSNRDGVKRYDWHELDDRRLGYAWYTDAPVKTLKAFAKWQRKHPGSTR